MCVAVETVSGWIDRSSTWLATEKMSGLDLTGPCLDWHANHSWENWVIVRNYELLGWETAKNFPFYHKATWIKLNFSNIFHFDIFVPVLVHSCNANTFTLNDNHHVKELAYTIRSNDQVFDVFKQFKANVECETVETLRGIQTHNGQLYMLMFDFINYCKNNEIRNEACYKDP